MGYYDEVFDDELTAGFAACVEFSPRERIAHLLRRAWRVALGQRSSDEEATLLLLDVLDEVMSEPEP